MIDYESKPPGGAAHEAMDDLAEYWWHIYVPIWIRGFLAGLLVGWLLTSLFG